LIWRKRTEGVAVLSAEDAIRYGCTGPVLRGSGVCYDGRKAFPYGGYADYSFDVPLGTNGDAFDRYRVRMEEMRQSRRIILQALQGLPGGAVLVDDRKVALPPRRELVRSMEAVIHQFKLVSEGIHPPAGEVYAAVESPRGEKGYYIVSDGSNRPVRVRVRSASFNNLQALPVMLHRGTVGDAVVAIASIDIVLGDVDRGRLGGIVLPSPLLPPGRPAPRAGLHEYRLHAQRLRPDPRPAAAATRSRGGGDDPGRRVHPQDGGMSRRVRGCAGRDGGH